MSLYPVILAGGAGSRLWPMSRESCPKQFLPLLDGKSPFQATIDRLEALRAQPATIVTSVEYRFLVADQLKRAGKALGAQYLEPFGRSTAPAIALVAYDLVRDDPDAVLRLRDRFRSHRPPDPLPHTRRLRAHGSGAPQHGRAPGRLCDRGHRREGSEPHGGGAHGCAPAAGPGRERELRGVGYLRAAAGHAEGDLPRGGRLRRGDPGGREDRRTGARPEDRAAPCT